MIDKIDRPEARHSYEITRPKDAKEDQHQSPNQREEQEKRYQKQLAEEKWQKFDRRTTVIKPLRANRETIERCLFKAVGMHSGAGTLQIDVVWKDGRTTQNALVLLKNLEDFIKLKKFAPGQEVPDEFWARGNMVELGIIEIISSGTGFSGKSEEKTEEKAVGRKTPRWLSSIGVTNSVGKRVNWGIVALYTFLLAIIIFAFVARGR